MDIAQALQKLCPGAEWCLDGEHYSGLTWLSKDIEKPTEIQIKKAWEVIQAEKKANEYRELRKKEYPPIEDYIDAVVKGDKVQMADYIDACLAVKEKYPKGGI